MADLSWLFGANPDEYQNAPYAPTSTEAPPLDLGTSSGPLMLAPSDTGTSTAAMPDFSGLYDLMNTASTEPSVAPSKASAPSAPLDLGAATQIAAQGPSLLATPSTLGMPPVTPTGGVNTTAATQIAETGAKGLATPTGTTTPTGPTSMVDKVLGAAGKAGDVAKSIGGKIAANPGRTAQGLLGLGSIASIGAGLLGGTKTPKYPPQLQAAMASLADSRARAAQTAQQVNTQLQASLSGNMNDVDPTLVRQHDLDLQQLRTQLRRDLGPGFETSTAGQNAISNREAMWQSVYYNARQQKINQLATIASQQGQLSNQGLDTIANLATAGATQGAADKRALLALGGQLGGMAVSPYLLQAMKGAVK